MAEFYDDEITLVNGEVAAIEPYRRVKYHSSAGQVVYADAADGDNWIGCTEPGPDGDAVAAGGNVKIRLRAPHRVLKCEAADAMATANADLYPANDGKITDTAGDVVIGKMALSSTGSAAGSIVSFHPYRMGGTNVEAHEHTAASDGGQLTSPRIVTGINDTNGNELLKVTATASAVNELTLANAATGNGPSLTASGETNVPVTIAAKGTGLLTLGQATGSVQIATAVGDLIGFYGTSPVAQRADASQVAITDNSGGAVSDTLAAITGGGAGCENATKNAIASLADKINEIRTVLVNLGLMKGAA